MLQLLPNPPLFLTTKFLHPNTHHPYSTFLPPNACKLTLNPYHLPHSIHQTGTHPIHKTHQQTKFNTISDFNHHLMELINSNQLQLASNLFSSLSSCEFQPNCWTYSVMIRCYCKNKEPHEAKRVVCHMLDKGFRPNVSTFTVLVNEFCAGGRVRQARDVIGLMGKINCEPTIQTYNCLLKGLCYVGKVEEAYELLINLKSKSSVEPDIYTYTAIMDGFCKVGRSGEALELLDEALKLGLVPNVATYNTLLTGYFKEGKPLEGIGLLKQMQERGCMPDYTAHSTLLHGLLKWGEIREALVVYKEMVRIGLRVDERMMNTLLRGLCRRSRQERVLLNDVYEVFNRTNGWEIDVYDFTFNLVIEAFCRGGKTEEALLNLDSMVQLGYNPKETTFENVIRTLCNEGRVEDASRVLVMYQKKGSPSWVSFRIVIDELNLQGKLFRFSAVYGLALKLGVRPKCNP